ncbi:MAG TPA: DNA-deoxyinosine glycosylase [Alphaproteobacteria bacterium]|nr:DNA-deoxyinosine glycosylase [Alphaproteobacteria bacterium]
MLRGFAPVCRDDARILILGSMPGAASLDAGRYYAHPRNAFWPIMGDILWAREDLPYDERLERLKVAGVALWDVVGSCRRRGSLDSAIEDETPNDFGAFFRKYKAIHTVLFNGRTAQALFVRRVLPDLEPFVPALVAMPSTSPAHAGMRFEEKRARWQEAMKESGRAGKIKLLCDGTI